MSLKGVIYFILNISTYYKLLFLEFNSSRFDEKFEKYNTRLMKLVQSLNCEAVDQVTLFNIINSFIDNVKECARLRNQPNSRGLKRIEDLLLRNFIDQESIKKMIEDLENNNSKHVETEAVNLIESLNINSVMKKSRSNDEFIDKLSEYPEGTLAFKYSTLWNNLTELNNLELSKSELKQSMIQLIEDFSQDFGGACQHDVLLVAFDQVINEIRHSIIAK